jgi:glycosyltransferase involved in cell wall biosynthesis
MKVYVNGKFALTRLTGVQRVAIEIIRAIQELNSANAADIQLALVEPPKRLQGSRWRPILAFLWEQCVLPFRTRDGVLLSPCNTGPLLKRRQAVIFHDAAVFDMPQNYGFRYRIVHRVLMRALAARAEKIFTVSQFSQRRLAANLKLPSSSIAVLGAAGEHIRRVQENPAILRKFNLHVGKYLVAVGSRQPGKNFSKLIEVIHGTGVPLVIVGGTDSGVFTGVSSAVRSEVIEVGHVSDEQLVSLLKHARGYIQPSLYEGFGLPVLEAMSLGTPVLCSKAGALPEVGGDAVIYFDPTESDDMLSAIMRLFSDDNLVERLRVAGLKRADSFSWATVASKLIDGLQCFRAKV